MTRSTKNGGGEAFRLSRRSVISAALAAAGGAQAFGQARPAPRRPRRPPGATSRSDVTTCAKAINLWAFPYPDKMSLEQCLQLAHDAGFDAIELNYDLENDLSPKSGTKEFMAIRKMAERIGIEISGVCSFLFWPYPMTSNDPAIRRPVAGTGRAR